MAIQITDFKIKKYRGLKDVSINSLNHINIFTGANNTGKTSLLELLNTLTNPLWGESWFQAVYPRNAGVSIYTELERMFPFGDNSIEYEFLKNNEEKVHHVSLVGKVTEAMVTNRELMRLNGYIQTGAPKTENEIPVQTKQIQMSVAMDEEIKEFGIYENQTSINTKGSDKKVYIHSTYLAPAAHYAHLGEWLKPLLKRTSINDGVLRMLQTFDPEIFSFVLLDNECFVNTRKHKEAIPLGTYGDGLKRAMVIMSAIANAPNGIVMIDEFETSFNRKAMKQSFGYLLKAAEENNVQLFLTSHSEEAILELLNVDRTTTEKANVYTLFLKSNNTKVRRLTGEKALDVTSWGISL